MSTSTVLSPPCEGIDAPSASPVACTLQPHADGHRHPPKAPQFRQARARAQARPQLQVSELWRTDNGGGGKYLCAQLQLTEWNAFVCAHDPGVASRPSDGREIPRAPQEGARHSQRLFESVSFPAALRGASTISPGRAKWRLMLAVILGLHAASAVVLPPVITPRQNFAVHSRRAVLAAVPTLFWATSAFGEEEGAPTSEAALAGDTAAPTTPLASFEATTIEYAELVEQLKDCRSTGVCAVDRVDFLSASGDSADAYIRGARKVRAVTATPARRRAYAFFCNRLQLSLRGVGRASVLIDTNRLIRRVAQTIRNLPVDDPNNDSSPLKLVAKCRDAGVPFTFSSIQAAIKATKGSSIFSVVPTLPKIF